MQASHTPDWTDYTSAVPDRLALVSSARAALSQQLAGRVDDHLATLVQHMREGLLAASTAVGLEVMAELMAAEVTELVGPKGRYQPARTAEGGPGAERGAVEGGLASNWAPPK